MGGAEVEGVRGEEEEWEGLEWVFVRVERVIGWIRLICDRPGREGDVAAARLPTRWVLVSVLSSVLTDDLLYVYDVLMSVEIVSGFHSSFSQFVWPAD